jgi:hypothetical protein
MTSQIVYILVEIVAARVMINFAANALGLPKLRRLVWLSRKPAVFRSPPLGSIQVQIFLAS